MTHSDSSLKNKENKFSLASTPPTSESSDSDVGSTMPYPKRARVDSSGDVPSDEIRRLIASVVRETVAPLQETIAAQAREIVALRHKLETEQARQNGVARRLNWLEDQQQAELYLAYEENQTLAQVKDEIQADVLLERMGRAEEDVLYIQSRMAYRSEVSKLGQDLTSYAERSRAVEAQVNSNTCSLLNLADVTYRANNSLGEERARLNGLEQRTSAVEQRVLEQSQNSETKEMAILRARLQIAGEILQGMETMLGDSVESPTSIPSSVTETGLGQRQANRMDPPLTPTPQAVPTMAALQTLEYGRDKPLSTAVTR